MNFAEIDTLHVASCARSIRRFRLNRSGQSIVSLGYASLLAAASDPVIICTLSLAGYTTSGCPATLRRGQASLQGLGCESLFVAEPHRSVILVLQAALRQ